MGNLLLYIIPFSYFAKTRLSLKGLFYHGVIEWVPMAIITIFYGNYRNLFDLLIGYILFISIYELGYVFNDLISANYEQNARKRFNHEIEKQEIIIFFLIRITLFCFILLFFPSQNQLLLIVGTITISVIFLIHNIIKDSNYKIFTFFSLAYFRFTLPLLYFLSLEVIVELSGTIILLYVFPRFISYLASKNLIALIERTSFKFKLIQTTIALPLTIFWSILYKSTLHAGWNIGLALIFLFLYIKNLLGSNSNNKN